MWACVRRLIAAAQVRLRIPVILLVVGVVVGRWEEIANRWEMVTRRRPIESVAGHAVSSDTEYFCPMDPGILSNWPDRCGICNMALVRRKRGEAAMLPEGVVARMQLSPYRIQLAGIRTEPAVFERLYREMTSSAIVARQGGVAKVTLEFPVRERPYLSQGLSVEVSSPNLPGREPLRGKIVGLSSEADGAWHFVRAGIEIGDHDESLSAGMLAVVRVRAAMADIEPFRSLPSDPPSYSASDPKRVYRCADHPGKVLTEAGRCAIDRNRLEGVALGELERVRWWCPMHPEVTAERAGAVCQACGGMALEARVVSYRPAGEVLTIPESAVVDSGRRRVVFVERMEGLFEGVEVVIGARCGDRYPVVRGLEPGQRVVVAGAFLLDAETRLNPGLAASYFGAARGERGQAGAGAAVDSGSFRSPASGPSPLPLPASGARANSLAFGDPLSGSPKKIGQNLLAHPPGATTRPDEARLAIGELDPGDRLVAERQKTCPVTGMRLGSMGRPGRVVVLGRTVLVCCDGCAPKLKAEPAKYLAKIDDAGRP
jgi:hypothetical protein